MHTAGATPDTRGSPSRQTTAALSCPCSPSLSVADFSPRVHRQLSRSPEWRTNPAAPRTASGDHFPLLEAAAAIRTVTWAPDFGDASPPWPPRPPKIPIASPPLPPQLTPPSSSTSTLSTTPHRRTGCRYPLGHRHSPAGQRRRHDVHGYAKTKQGPANQSSSHQGPRRRIHDGLPSVSWQLAHHCTFVGATAAAAAAGFHLRVCPVASAVWGTGGAASADSMSVRRRKTPHRPQGGRRRQPDAAHRCGVAEAAATPGGRGPSCVCRR